MFYFHSTLFYSKSTTYFSSVKKCKKQRQKKQKTLESAKPAFADSPRRKEVEAKEKRGERGSEQEMLLAHTTLTIHSGRRSESVLVIKLPCHKNVKG